MTTIGERITEIRNLWEMGFLSIDELKKAFDELIMSSTDESIE